MTCRELYAINNPDMGDPVDNGDCPDDYGYVPGDCHFCDPGRPMEEWDCDGCWNQEISEESKTINNLVDEACAFNPEIDRHGLIEAIETLRNMIAKDRDKPLIIGNYEFTKRKNGEMTMSYVGAKDPAPTEENNTPHILDSGNRREFESGAVRDIQEGKGRCDLLPLDVVSVYMKNEVIRCIYDFQSTNTTDHLLWALHHFCGKRVWNNETMLLEVAKHFEEGCKKYGENNWQKGIPGDLDLQA